MHIAFIYYLVLVTIIVIVIICLINCIFNGAPARGAVAPAGAAIGPVMNIAVQVLRVPQFVIIRGPRGIVVIPLRVINFVRFRAIRQ